MKTKPKILNYTFTVHDLEVEEFQGELISFVDLFFPKLKPNGTNKGRGEALVIVGTAVARYGDIFKKYKKMKK